MNTKGKRSSTQSSLVRAYRNVKGYLLQPHVIILIILILLLGALVLTPLFKIVQGSLVWHTADRRLVGARAEPGAFSFYHWKRMFVGPLSTASFFRPLLHSVVTSIGASLISLSIGISLAWFVVRTNIPWRGVISSFGVLPFLMPSWVLANAWIVLFKNEAIGGYPGIFTSLTGLMPPNWISYGRIPIMVALGIHYSTFSFLLISATLGSVDTRLEEVGTILGSTRFHVLRRITFPVVMPAIVTSFVLTFSRSLGNFGTPHFLGAPVGYRTLATVLYGKANNLRYGDAWVVAAFLIASTIVLIYYSGKFSEKKERYQTVSGKSSRRHRVNLGRWRMPILGIVMVFILAVMVVPTLLFFWQSLMMKAGKFGFQNITFHFWIGHSDPNIADGIPGILRHPLILGALRTTVQLGIASAFVGSFTGIFLGYGIIKGKGSFLSKLADQISFIPYLMPSIAIGAIFIAMFGTPLGPIPALYGTFWILLIGMVVKNIPFASRTGISTMLQVGESLEEASNVIGASWTYTFRRVIAPLAIGGFITGFILTLIIAMKELDLVVLLASSGNETLSTAALALAEQGVPQLQSATIFLQLVCIYVVVFAGTKLFGVNIEEGLRMG